MRFTNGQAHSDRNCSTTRPSKPGRSALRCRYRSAAPSAGKV